MQAFLEGLNDLLTHLPQVDVPILAERTYQLLAHGMSYVFVLIFAVLILSVALSLRETQQDAAEEAEAEGVLYLGTLQVVRGGRTRRYFVGEDITLGRHKRCDITLEGRGIARWHARLYHTDRGAMLSPLDRRHGVAVNGEPITRRTLIEDGAHITLGQVEMVYRSAEEVEP